MHVSRLALGLAFPLIVVACGGVDGTTGAPAASNDGDGNGSGGDTTTNGQGICGGTSGCVGVYIHDTDRIHHHEASLD